MLQHSFEHWQCSCWNLTVGRDGSTQGILSKLDRFVKPVDMKCHALAKLMPLGTRQIPATQHNGSFSGVPAGCSASIDLSQRRSLAAVQQAGIERAAQQASAVKLIKWILIEIDCAAPVSKEADGDDRRPSFTNDLCSLNERGRVTNEIFFISFVSSQSIMPLADCLSDRSIKPSDRINFDKPVRSQTSTCSANRQNQYIDSTFTRAFHRFDGSMLFSKSACCAGQVPDRDGARQGFARHTPRKYS